MAEWPSGTVTFLFTDLEGSTQRWQQYPAAMGPALARHDRLLRDAIAAHGGVVFKTVGDAVCAAFASAPAAVAAALAAQRALYGEPWGATGPLRVRMALHTGQAEAQAGDYLGGPLNRVARILALGHGGQVLLSGPTADLVQDYLPPGVALRDMGTHRLKDVYRPEHVFQLVAPDLPADFAPLAATAATAVVPEPQTDPVNAPAGGRGSKPLPIVAAVVVAVALVGTLAVRRFGGGNDGSDAVVVAPTVAAFLAPAPTLNAAATDAPAIAPTNSSAAFPAATASPGAEVGRIVYSLSSGQPGAGHVYRIVAREGAAPEDLSAGLDARWPGGADAWVAASSDGAWLLLGTERFDPACVGWPCLAVASGDLTTAEPVRIDGAVVHPLAPGAIAGGLIVVPLAEGPHETDLWAIRRSAEGWDAPVLLTGGSPYAYQQEPALAADGSRIAFECGDRPYGETGTALCVVGTDGAGFRVLLAPADAPAGLPPDGALRHPAYAPSGAVVFEATWDGRIWRLPAKGGTPEPVGPPGAGDVAPCALPDGRAAVLWLGRPGNEGLHELRVLGPDGGEPLVLVTDLDVAQIGCGG